MPYAHFPEDQVSLWFETNFPVHAGVARLHPGRQTVLLLPYIGFDITSLTPQFRDPILSSRCNLIAVDFRSQGKTVNPLTEQHDNWVNAAGLLKLLARLQIPGVHVFASGALSIGTALRFTLLWPTGVQSLALISVHRPLEQWLIDTFKQIVIDFATARTIDAIEDIINELVPYLFYDGLPDDELNFFASYIMKQYPPKRMSRFNDMLFDFLTQSLTPLTPAQLALIKQPVLIISPEETVTCSREPAEELAKQLANSVSVQTHIMNFPASACSYTRCSYPRVNRLFSSFLSSIHSGPKKVKQLPNMAAALRALADLTGNASIKERDPQKVLSFSCVGPQDMADEQALRQQIRMVESGAINPVDPDAELPRKFTERHDENFFGKHRKPSNGEWLYAAIDVRVGQRDHVGSDTEVA